MLRVLCAMMLALAAAVPTVVTATDGHCWSDWSDAAPVVQREALKPAKEIADGFRARGKEVVRMTLCEERGRYIYRMVVVNGGRVETLTVDAGKSY